MCHMQIPLELVSSHTGTFLFLRVLDPIRTDSNAGMCMLTNWCQFFLELQTVLREGASTCTGTYSSQSSDLAVLRFLVFEQSRRLRK